MKIKATISVMDETVKGMSRATGREWMKKELVVKLMEEDGLESTIAISTMNQDVIKVLESCSVGSEVMMDVAFQSRVRVFTRKDGSEGVIRSTECFVKSMEALTY